MRTGSAWSPERAGERPAAGYDGVMKPFLLLATRAEDDVAVLAVRAHPGQFFEVQFAPIVRVNADPAHRPAVTAIGQQYPDLPYLGDVWAYEADDVRDSDVGAIATVTMGHLADGRPALPGYEREERQLLIPQTRRSHGSILRAVSRLTPSCRRAAVPP